MSVGIVKGVTVAREARQKMVEGTAALLAKRGLQATSFSTMLSATGTPRGSLYHHFPGGKAELVAEAVRLAGDRALARLDGMSGQPAVEVARSFFDLWRQVLTRSQLTAGCAVVAVTVAADSSGLLDQAATVFRSWRTRLAELLRDGGLRADQADRVAATLIAASEGAVVLARAERSLEPFELVTEALLAQF